MPKKSQPWLILSIIRRVSATLITSLMGMQNGTANSVKQFLIKLNIYYLPHNPAIPLIGISIYSREMKAYIHTKTCT